MKFKGYKFSFRINCTHSTDVDKKNIHNHTLSISVMVEQGSAFMETADMQGLVLLCINKYDGAFLNEISPFDELVPTVENLGREIFAELNEIFKAHSMKMCELSICEKPSQIFTIKDIEVTDRRKQAFLNAAQKINYINEIKHEETKAESLPAHNEEPAKMPAPVVKLKEGRLVKQAKSSVYILPVSFAILCLGGLVVMLIVKATGMYPLGLDIHGHLFKSDLMYNEIKKGNIYPLYTQYWYNGLQPYRYWPPMPYYFMALLQGICGGSVISAYLGFVFSSFVIGGFGWLLFGRKLNRPMLGLFMSLVWFFLPDNLRVFFGEGNLPRMFITMLLPTLFYCIWQFVCYKRKKIVFPLIALMTICVLGHLMISAMIGVGTFVFLLIYSIVNKRFKESFWCILAMLFTFAVAGLWVYPSLVGGITSMSSDGTSELMASLSAKLTTSLNPLLRLDGRVTELYFGLSIALIAVVGLFLSNRKSASGFVSLLIVIAGTTTALTPIIQKIPFSQLFWIRRFAPIGYAMFCIALLEWRKLKKPVLVTACVLIAIDCVPSFMLSEYDNKMNIPATVETMDSSADEYLFKDANEITSQRVSLMDLSTFGPFPSYAFGTQGETQYVFGWAWQGAATANNIVQINEALENENFDFMFDRNLELGADSVIVDINLVNETSLDELVESAQRVGYSLVSQSDESMLFSLGTQAYFGVKTDYSGIAIGTTASIVPQIFPYFTVGDKEYIDDYSVDELSGFEKIYLSGFFYKNKSNAEALVRKLAENGVEIFIDMSNIPSDPLTTRMTFLDVSAQPITINQRYPALVTDTSIIRAQEFIEDNSQWNTVYLNNLDTTLGYAWFENEKLDFIGKSEDGITYIGFNLLYHALMSKDESVYDYLNSVIDLADTSLPEREIIPLEITYETNKITITSTQDNVNTTIAYQDNFVSSDDIKNVNNLLVVNKGTTVVELEYPYFGKGLIVSLAGILAECILIYSMLHKRRAKKFTRQKYVMTDEMILQQRGVQDD